MKIFIHEFLIEEKLFVKVRSSHFTLKIKKVFSLVMKWTQPAKSHGPLSHTLLLFKKNNIIMRMKRDSSCSGTRIL